MLATFPGAPLRIIGRLAHFLEIRPNLGTGQHDDTHIVKKQGTMRIRLYAAFSAARAMRSLIAGGNSVP